MMYVCVLFLLLGDALSQYQAQPKVRTNDGNLHLQGASVVIDTPGSTVRLPSALDALANQANATRTELATQLSAVNAEIRVSREAERRQAGSISNAVAAIASSTETLGGLIEETSAATLSTIIEASANHSTSVSEIEAAVANQCGGASFVRADPANATASSAMTVWGRDFIPAASGLYQCKFLLAHNSRLHTTAAVAAINSTALVCRAPDDFGLPEGQCSGAMALNVFENGNRLGHAAAAGFAMHAVGLPPAFNQTIPAIDVRVGGVAPTVTRFGVVANLAYGAVTIRATSSDQRVVQNGAITARLANGVATISFATLVVVDMATTITVVVANPCGSNTQSFVVTVIGRTRFHPWYRVANNGHNNTNHAGVDLSDHGLELCYGWRNTGSSHAPTYDYLRETCGQYKRILIAGWRCRQPNNVNNLIRYTQNGRFNQGNDFTPITLQGNRRFIDILPEFFPTSQRQWNNIDTRGRYKWMMSRPWYLLVNAGNAWSDPGRLWEPSASRGRIGNWATDTRGCSMGHVLSVNGNNAHDQSGCCGDTYLIYGDPDSV